MAEPSITERGDDADPVALFKARLQQFQTECGGPSIRALERLFAIAGRPQSRSVIQAKLTGRTTPDWTFVESFVEACVRHAGTGADPDLPAWRERHTAMLAAVSGQRRTSQPEPETDPRPGLQLVHARIRAGDLAAPRPSAGGEPGPVALARARTDLAAVVARQWAAETEIRSLYRPEPVRVRWSLTERPLTPGGARPSRPDYRGGLADLVEQFRRLPARQLVVLGEPGAGKTVAAIMLTLGLLGDPQPDDPVPVLLTMAGWNPLREHVHTWLARHITEEYPGLANTKMYGPDTAKRLVTDGHILPVLDGLDETPPGMCAAAIDALDKATGGGRPFVVTCRRAEYEDAVRREGVIFGSALVVEIEPVGLDDAATFLMARQPQGDTRWATVLDHLRQDPDAPLAQALSTPLMVDLARTAYTPVTADPVELVDRERFPTRTAVEEHLLDSFLPAAYAREPRPPASADRPVVVPHYSAAEAQRWLAFLARYLDARQTRDIQWWTMISALPRLTRGLVLGLPAAVLFFLTGLFASGPVVAVVYGTASAIAGGLANAFARPSEPRHVEIRVRGTGARFAGRFAIGVVLGVALGLGWSLSAGLVVLLALVFGTGIGLPVWLDAPAEVDRVAGPALNLRQDRLATFGLALSYAMSLGLFYGVANAFTAQQRFLPVFGGSFDLALALAGALAGGLMGRFTYGRLGGAVWAVAGAAMGGMVFPALGRLPAGIGLGALFALATVLMVVPGRAWAVFVACRLMLAARGDTPARLMAFLDDAHQRGVLRQAGAVYQFRHARLQDRLASLGVSPRGRFQTTAASERSRSGWKRNRTA